MERFTVIDRLGPKVWKCNDLLLNEVVVVKCVLGNELRLIRDVQKYKDQFINVHYDFEHKKMKYVVMEYVADDLINYLDENLMVSEEEGKRIFSGILTAVITLAEETGYYHADIKAENVVIDEFLNVKLIDFGLMIKTKGEKPSKMLERGTMEYFPPELLSGTAESFVVWTLGLILYRLLVGSSILFDDETGVVKSNIGLAAKYVEYKDGADLLKRCLNPNYRKRPSLKEILNHRWLTGKSNKKNLIICCV